MPIPTRVTTCQATSAVAYGGEKLEADDPLLAIAHGSPLAR